MTTSLYDGDLGDNNVSPRPVVTPDQPAPETAAAQQVPPNPQWKRPIWLNAGSDVEVAGYVGAELMRDYGTVHYCEGEFWLYEGTHWKQIAEEQLRLLIHEYDGLPWGPNGRPVQLSKGRIDRILYELGAKLRQRDFFEGRPAGINCENGFISFDRGRPQLLPHDTEHRQRHVIPARWELGCSAEIPLVRCWLGS